MANAHITMRRRLQPMILFFTALAMVLAAGPRELLARENAYDVLGKTLVPFVKALVASPKMQSHAAMGMLSLESATNLPAQDMGDTLQFALLSPDKLVIRAKVAGQAVTLRRDGQKLWAFPGTQIKALIDAQQLPKADPGYKLTAGFNVPVSEKQLVWLPLLFNVTDEGDDAVGGVNCMVLDVSLVADAAKAMKAQDYSARLWITADYKVARIVLRKGRDWKAVISVKDAGYPATLPAETWQPTQAEAGDVMQITPALYKQLMDAVGAKWAGFKSAVPGF